MCSLIIESRNIESQIADSDPVYKPLIIKTSPRSLRSLRLIIYGESCGMTVNSFLYIVEMTHRFSAAKSVDVYRLVRP